MSQQSTEHWQEVWSGRDPLTTSWFQSTPGLSLELLSAAAPSASSVVDIGSGRSTFVSSVMAAGMTQLEVLDISASAMAAAAAEAGHPEEVTWTTADITTHRFKRTFDVWHDRAVFHFLTETAQRDGYRDALASGTHSGSIVIVSTFAEDGPEACSGLPVRRYSAEALAAEFPGFETVTACREAHVKPDGEHQSFQYVVLRRVD